MKVVSSQVSTRHPGLWTGEVSTTLLPADHRPGEDLLEDARCGLVDAAPGERRSHGGRDSSSSGL